MAKLRKVKSTKTKTCQELHSAMNINGFPTKLVDPKVFMISNTDNIQNQVNCLENKVSKMERSIARYKWVMSGGRRWK